MRSFICIVIYHLFIFQGQCIDGQDNTDPSPVEHQSSSVRQAGASFVKQEVPSPKREEESSSVKQEVPSPKREEESSSVKQEVPSPKREEESSSVKQEVSSPKREKESSSVKQKGNSRENGDSLNVAKKPKQVLETPSNTTMGTSPVGSSSGNAAGQLSTKEVLRPSPLMSSSMDTLGLGAANVGDNEPQKGAVGPDAQVLEEIPRAIMRTGPFVGSSSGNATSQPSRKELFRPLPLTHPGLLEFLGLENETSSQRVENKEGEAASSDEPLSRGTLGLSEKIKASEDEDDLMSQESDHGNTVVPRDLFENPSDIQPPLPLGQLRTRSKVRKVRSFSEFDPGYLRDTLSAVVEVNYAPHKGFVTLDDLQKETLSREKYFGLTGVLRPELHELAQQIRGLSKYVKPLPKAFICYAWKEDNKENKEWQEQQILPLRLFLRESGIEATVDIVDNNQGGIRSYRETIKGSVDFVVTMIDENFIKKAIEWKKWHQDLEKQLRDANDGSTQVTVSDQVIDEKLKQKPNLWKELEVIQERINRMRKEGKSYQFVIPLLMGASVRHTDITRIWDEEFVFINYVTSEQQYENVPRLPMIMFDAYHNQVKGIEEPHDYREVYANIKKQVSDFKSRKDFLWVMQIESKQPNQNLRDYTKLYLIQTHLSSLFCCYEFAIQGGNGPSHGYNLRSLPSFQDSLDSDFSSSQEDLRSPVPGQENKQQCPFDPMDTYRKLSAFSFQQLMSFYSSQKDQEEIGIFHLIMAKNFERSLSEVESVIRGKNGKSLLCQIGNYTFKAYDKAYSLLYKRPSCELLAAQAALGCGRMQLDKRTEDTACLESRKAGRLAVQYFKKALHLDEEHFCFVAHYYLAKTYMILKDYSAVTKEVRKYFDYAEKYSEFFPLEKEETDQTTAKALTAGETAGSSSASHQEMDEAKKARIDEIQKAFYHHIDKAHDFLKKIQKPARKAYEIQKDFAELLGRRETA
jgi:hypothetical protein